MKASIKRQDIPGILIMFIIGLAVTFLGFTKFKNALDAKKWPATKGLITRSEVAGSTKYYPSITYSYVVDSTTYNSNSISNINFITKNRKLAQEFIDKYPLGSEIMIHYNNANPTEAFLEPGLNQGNILLLCFGIILVIVPILIIIFMKVDLRKDGNI
jgi:hypothetical protein